VIHLNGSFGAYARSSDDIVNAMASKLLSLQGRIQTINDFFMPFDGHDKRVYEAWELQLMFQNEISKDEAQIVCSQKGQGYAITHNQLADLIRLKTGMMPGNAPF